MPPGKRIQRRAPSTLYRRQHRDQRYQAEPVGPYRDIQQDVVIDQRQDEHADEAGREPEHLLLIEVDKFCVQRRAVNFQHADHRESEHKGQQGPVEVAIGKESAHGLRSCLPLRSATECELESWGFRMGGIRDRAGGRRRKEKGSGFERRPGRHGKFSGNRAGIRFAVALAGVFPALVQEASHF